MDWKEQENTGSEGLSLGSYLYLCFMKGALIADEPPLKILVLNQGFTRRSDTKFGNPTLAAAKKPESHMQTLPPKPSWGNEAAERLCSIGSESNTDRTNRSIEAG